MEKLFTGFNTVSSQQWKEQIVKDLKGIDFNTLLWKTSNGFDVKPFYTSEDSTSAGSPLFTHHDWDIAERIEVINEKTANAAALAALNGGASALIFHLDGNKNIEQLLSGIYIEHIAIQFVLDSDVALFGKQLQQLISQRQLQPEALRLTVNYDILSYLAGHGQWLTNEAADMGDVETVFNWPFNAHRLLVDAQLYQNAGASQVTELALILCHYNEYLNGFESKGLDLKQLKNGAQFNIAIGSDFFMEIAKLRALRQLLPLVNSAYSVEIPAYMSCSTSGLTQTAKDAYTNLLRTTTQAMSAVLGGANVLEVQPFDTLYQDSDNFSKRMARNQQIILKEESYLNKVADMGAGSYYIETITNQLAEHAWELFKTWEGKGGFKASLSSGLIQKRIATEAADLKAKAAVGELVIIGANKYMNPKDEAIQVKTNGSQPAADSLFEPIQALRLAEAFEKEPVK